MTNYITKTIKNGVEANIPVTSVWGSYWDVWLKTVNSNSLVGSGNISVQATLSNITAAQIKTWTATTQTSVTAAALAGWLARISNASNNTTSSWLKIWTGTQANYDAITTKDSATLYITTD